MTAPPWRRGDVAVLVPAAGRGERLGPGLPKALRELAGEPLLAHAVRRLAAAPSVGALVVAAPPGAERDVTSLLAPVLATAPETDLVVVTGGANRQESVAVALAAADPAYDIVLVHDAARAFAPPELVERVAAAVRDGRDAVIPVLPVVDTIKQVDDAGVVVSTPDRAALRVVQTPQGFRRKLLATAHATAHAAAAATATDDAGLVESLGAPVYTVPGNPAALKVTHPTDLAIAELLLRDS